MIDTTPTPAAAGLTPNRRAQMFLELVDQLQIQNQARGTARAAGVQLDTSVVQENEKRIRYLSGQLGSLESGQARSEAEKTLRSLERATRAQAATPPGLPTAFKLLHRWDSLTQEIRSLSETRQLLPQKGSTRDLEWQQDRAREAFSATLLEQQRQLGQVFRVPALARGRLETLAREHGERTAYQTLLERPETLGALRGFEAAGLATPARQQARRTAAGLARTSLDHLDRLDDLRDNLELARHYQAVQSDLKARRDALGPDRSSLLATLGRSAQGHSLEDLQAGLGQFSSREIRLLANLESQDREYLEPLQKLTQTLEWAMYRAEPERFLDLAKKTAKLAEQAPPHILTRLGPESLRLAGAAAWVARGMDRVVERGVG